MVVRVYEVPKEKLQKIKELIEAPDQPLQELDIEIEKEQGKGKFEKAKAWKENEFKKQEILLRDSKSLGITGDSTFLYIKGTEDFFERNEKLLLEAGAKRLQNKKEEEIRNKIEHQQEEASMGVGFIFQ